MLPAKPQKGSILIILIVLLALSFGVLTVSKFFASSQANVETAIESRYQITPSNFMDPVDKWISENNSNYKFELFYPKQWVASKSPKGVGKEQFIVEKSLSNKIKLRLSVFKDYEIPKNQKQAKFGQNSFYLLTDTGALKSSVLKTENQYYLVELSQQNYFPTEVEFKGTYFQILKKFKYTGK